jgi:tetratricopeptide (TPR) repeat protein
MYQPVPLVALVLLGLMQDAQSQTQLAMNEQKPCEIWGQVAGDARRLQDGLDIELIGRDKAAKQRVHVSNNGNFDFQPVPPGGYHFRVIDRNGTLIHEQTESLGGKPTFVLLLIPDSRSEDSARNTVSFAALQHKTPARAWDAFRAAQKAGSAGDTEKCIQRLNEALSIDPDFAEAQSDLAARYAKMGRIDEALQHAEAAFSLNSALPEAGCNFALLLVSLKRYPEAETLARRLLNGPSYLPELHGVLAISLIGQRRKLDEALDHLRQAATEIPFITLLAARALAETGKATLAVDQVKAYLQSSAHECERQELEAWVSSVQSQLASQSHPEE